MGQGQKNTGSEESSGESQVSQSTCEPEPVPAGTQAIVFALSHFNGPG